MSLLTRRILKGLATTVGLVVVAIVGFIVIMFVTTGGLNIQDFKDRLSSDYRDLEFGRPPKENFFSEMFSGDENAEVIKVDGDRITEEYYEQRLYTLSRLGEALLYYETGDEIVKRDESTRLQVERDIVASIKEMKDLYDDHAKVIEKMDLTSEEVRVENSLRDAIKAYKSDTEQLLIALRDKNNTRFNEYAEKIVKGHSMILLKPKEDMDMDNDMNKN